MQFGDPRACEITKPVLPDFSDGVTVDRAPERPCQISTSITELLSNNLGGNALGWDKVPAAYRKSYKRIAGRLALRKIALNLWPAYRNGSGGLSR